MSFPYSYNGEIITMVDKNKETDKKEERYSDLFSSFKPFNLTSNKETLVFESRNSLAPIGYSVKIIKKKINQNFVYIYQIQTIELTIISLLTGLIIGFFLKFAISGLIIFTLVFTPVFYWINIAYIIIAIRKSILKQKYISELESSDNEYVDEKIDVEICQNCNAFIPKNNTFCTSCKKQYLENNFFQFTHISKFAKKKISYSIKSNFKKTNFKKT
jgi:ribosomal protein L40E